MNAPLYTLGTRTRTSTFGVCASTSAICVGQHQHPCLRHRYGKISFSRTCALGVLSERCADVALPKVKAGAFVGRMMRQRRRIDLPSKMRLVVVEQGVLDHELALAWVWIGAW